MHIYLPSELVLKARLFRGLSAPSRRALIEAVRDGEHSVAHLVAALGLSHPTVSARLAWLHDCGLAEKRQVGRAMPSLHRPMVRLKRCCGWPSSASARATARRAEWLRGCTR